MTFARISDRGALGFTAKAGKNTSAYDSVTSEKGTATGSVAFRSTMS
ncbi:hypothetical protein [Streptomyces massasporeus]